MAKGGKKRSAAGSRGARNGDWSAADHAERPGKASKTVERADRTAWLTHDTVEKRNGLKVKLHVTQTKRHVETLRKRLKRWDPVEEAAKTKKKQAAEEAEQRRLRAEQEQQKGGGPASSTNQKRGRSGPETWKLRGAARPAHEVYDFDTRYVDPHVQAHKEAAQKATRVQNLLHPKLFDAQAIPECREYLGLLMQLGHICEEAKQYKTAREAWLECIELDNDEEPLTSARDALMRLYVKLQRYKDAYKLGKQFGKDSSVWIRYHAALSACLLNDQVQDQQQLMAGAVKSNIFCAYYLAHYDTFRKVMEYTEELDEAETEPQSSLEEAIEYCGNGADSAILLWQENPSALVSLRSILRGNVLSTEDLDWSDRLAKIEKESRKHNHSIDDSGFDLGMYAGQFRTAMEMLGDAGDLSGSTTR